MLEKSRKSCSEAIWGFFGHPVVLPRTTRFGAVRGQIDDKSDDNDTWPARAVKAGRRPPKGSLDGPGKLGGHNGEGSPAGLPECLWDVFDSVHRGLSPGLLMPHAFASGEIPIWDCAGRVAPPVRAGRVLCWRRLDRADGLARNAGTRRYRATRRPSRSRCSNSPASKASGSKEPPTHVSIDSCSS